MVNKFKSKLVDLFEWINRRWILSTMILTIVFWVISSNFLIALMVAFLFVVFFIMIHAIIELNKLKKGDK